MKKKLLVCLAIGFLMFGMAEVSNATIVDLPDVNGVGYFYDTAKGYTWLDIDTFVSKSFNEVEAALQGTSFSIATGADLREMHLHALAEKPLPEYFDYWCGIMGTAYQDGLPWIWGIYDNGVPGQYASAWVGGNPYSFWIYVDPEPTGMFPEMEPNDRDYIDQGQGIWALSKVPNPNAPFPYPVTIDIRPWSKRNPINYKGHGILPVAILSTEYFDAPSQVDQDSLTFGATGDEKSLAFCNRKPRNVSRDGSKDDLVCHFYIEIAGFKCGDAEGILKGKTLSGSAIEGEDLVRIINCK